MGSRTPDQFRLSRLKEGERVCGGRGQFGKQPLWKFNTISKLRIQRGQCDMINLTNWKESRRVEFPFLKPR